MKKIFFRILLPLTLIGGTAIWMYYHPNIDEGKTTKVMTLCWTLISLGLISITVAIVDALLNKILPWKKRTALRFFAQLLLGGLSSLASLNLAYYLIKDYYTSEAPDLGQYLVMNMYGSSVVLPIFSIYFGYNFLKDWRKSELETERLQKENARSQMMALKNHLDPHFLFNNLNILSSIMDKDITLSKTYLDKFAEVYRIILKSEQSDLSLLEDEMQLIESYIYLIRVRFENSVFFDIDIDPADHVKALPPLAIQMLIENAIKHNMANADNPITITIKSDGQNNILVQNNLQKKKYAIQERDGSGLQNIQNRYAFFSDKEMQVEETESYFRITLPLLEIDYD